MADLLSIGASGISVYQRALATVSNNIANLSTDGYSRQTTEIRQNQPVEVGNGYIGTGAYFDGVSRQYDGFLESSLQQATADLESEGAAAEYASRLLDILGDEKIGLTTALNQFFSAAKALSTEPASPALRGSMLRDGEALATRFQSLSEQMSDLGEQSLSALEASVRSANALSSQLAEVNRQLQKQSSAQAQPPELLDRRDQLLRDLSEYVQIRTSFDNRGLVTVSVSESTTKGKIVAGLQSSELYVNPLSSDQNRLEYRLQGRLGTETLTGIPSGKVAGYADFYEKTLVTVNNRLNELARVLVTEVNDIQTTGLNGKGEQGQAFFSIEPTFDVQRDASASDFQVDVSVTDPENYQIRPVSVTYDDSRQRWYAENVDGSVVFANQNGLLVLDDISIQITGDEALGDRFQLVPDVSAARGMRLGLSDGLGIAAASMFRITPNAKNNGIFDPVATFSGIPNTDSGLVNFEVFGSGRAIGVDSSVVNPLTVISAGQDQVEFELDLNQGSGNVLQVMTTDGQHLIGSAADGEVLGQAMKQSTQFSAGSNYSSEYLNTSGRDGYKNLDIFYGISSEAAPVTQLLPLNSLFFEAPVGTDFAGGGLDFTLEPANANDRLSLLSSRYIDTSIGALSVADGDIYMGDGASSSVIASTSDFYDGNSQTLRIQFAEDLASDFVTDELAGRIASLVTYSSGEDLTTANNPLKKRINGELFTADFSVNLVESRDFISSELVAAGQIVTGQDQFMAKLVSRNVAYASGAGRVLIDAGDLRLNGVDLGALVVGDSGVLSTSDVKSWLDAAETDIEVSVSNIVEIPSELVQLNSGYGLTLNGISVVSLATNTQSSFSSIDDLVFSINAVTDESGVFASRNQLGDLQIQNLDLGGENIVLGGTSGLPGNVLGIGSKTYIGNLELELTSSSEEAIVFELGDDGKPSDLNLLGLNTQVRLSGDIDEDLVVFLTGDGRSSLEAFALASEADVTDQLRGRQLEFYFDSENSYQIRDLVTGTVLANRTYQGELALDYQGIDITLDNRAVIGDRFVVDGNNLGPNGSFDGQGNNSNILRFVDLESKGVLSGGETISEGYLKFVGDVGNVTTQSEIARDALSIVQQQAIEARDRVSGVSLDKEAADLIRFQQAYQASAQVMQVATKLFDTVLQVR